MTKDEIFAAVDALDVDALVRSGAADTPDFTDTMISDVIGWGNDWKKRFTSHITACDDPMEFPNSVALHYIELKARWMGLNTKLSYLMMLHGDMAPDVQWHLTVTSSFIDAIEPKLSPADLNKITELISAPTQGHVLATA